MICHWIFFKLKARKILKCENGLIATANFHIVINSSHTGNQVYTEPTCPRDKAELWTCTWSEGHPLHCKEIKSHLNFFKMRTVFADGKKPMRTRWHLGATPNLVQDTQREDSPERSVSWPAKCYRFHKKLFLATVLRWPPGLREHATWIWPLLLFNFHLSFNFHLQGISAGARQTWYLLCPSSSHPCHCCSH